MAMLTATDLREKTKHELELAQERVRTLEEQLKWIEDAIKESGDQHSEQMTANEDSTDDGQQPLLAPVGSSDENTPGRVIRELMENAPGEFNVPGVVKAVLSNFPNLDYATLSKKGSQIANRLAKKEKIKVIHKGEGRHPNTYVSTKYTGK